MYLNFATLNVNGLNSVSKQMDIVSIVRLYKIDILCIQEHNVREFERLDYLKSYFEIIWNEPLCFKGGTVILLNKISNLSILKTEKDTEGNVIFVKISYNGIEISILNVYAPSGNNRRTERECMFKDDLMFYLRNNISNVIMAGDWNSILSPRDCTSENSTLVSQSLKSLVSDFKLKDCWFSTNYAPQFTYLKKNYGSRTDRIYVKDLYDNIISCDNIPVHFSDHSMILVKIKTDNRYKIGKGIWKLNCKLLEEEDVITNFEMYWQNVVGNMRRYENILSWWVEYAKPECKRFFIKANKRQNEGRYGLLNMLQHRLKQIYLKFVGSENEWNEICLLKDRIKMIKDDVYEEVMVRNRVLDRVEGEKVSSHLLCKEKETASRKMITEMFDNEGSLMKNTETVIPYIRNFYRDLYGEVNTDMNFEKEFLNQINSVVTEGDNCSLTGETSEKEVLGVVKSMNKGKSPGEDGLPAEFYLKTWHIIRREFIGMVEFVLEKETLGKQQNSGIIKLLPKEGDLRRIQNWRPVSLLGVDCKIISKLIANRLRDYLEKCISKEQFCSVKGRSIVNCNTLIRDIMYYVNSQGKRMAMMNLDWSKAFDRVPINFLVKVLKKYGFDDRNCYSALCINGIVGCY